MEGGGWIVDGVEIGEWKVESSVVENAGRVEKRDWRVERGVVDNGKWRVACGVWRV